MKDHLNNHFDPVIRAIAKEVNKQFHYTEGAFKNRRYSEDLGYHLYFTEGLCDSDMCSLRNHDPTLHGDCSTVHQQVNNQRPMTPPTIKLDDNFAATLKMYSEQCPLLEKDIRGCLYQGQSLGF